MGYVDIAAKNGKFYIIESIRKIDEIIGLKDAFDFYIQDIDEMVALPIIAFWEKGYKTEMSCSSHCFYSLSSGYASECSQEESVFSVFDYDLNDTEVFFLDKEVGKKRFWISFEEDYFRNFNLPQRWEYSKNTSMPNVTYDLYRSLEAKDDLDLMDVQIRAVKELMEWIDTLPTLKQN